MWQAIADFLAKIGAFVSAYIAGRMQGDLAERNRQLEANNEIAQKQREAAAAAPATRQKLEDRLKDGSA